MIKIAPSLLAADFGHLAVSLAQIEEDADLLHLDVMDGHFVPNISFGLPVIKAVKQLTNLPLDVHLMITNPDVFLAAFVEAGADIITVHAEACSHLHRTVSAIKNLDCKVGVALNPHTPLYVLDYILQDIDLVLIMSVNPGYGGQSFIQSMLPKISQVAALVQRSGLSHQVVISVDGGINIENVRAVSEAGAQIVVAGSAVFKAVNPSQAIRDLKSQGF